MKKINAANTPLCGMTKIRTLIPANARAGKSIIQVINPLTGKAVRVRVPKEAIPGQAIELDIPDGPESSADQVVSPLKGDDPSRLPPPNSQTVDQGASDVTGPEKPGMAFNYTGMLKLDILSFDYM